MKILFVVGSCLKSNSSANLCHMAYVKGALKCGYDVTVISVSEKDMPIDKGVALPTEVNWHYFDSAFYTRYSYRKSLSRRTASEGISSGTFNDSDAEQKRSWMRRMKDLYVNSRGIYGFDLSWIKKSISFRSDELYDCVISLAWPPASHEAARCLIAKGRVKTRCWCQIWEDPWYLDLWMKRDQRRYEEEKKLIAAADKVMYVSPITLKYQKEVFHEYQEKMFWMPLPFYYINNEKPKDRRNTEKVFGYYGDYHPHIRNLRPFYEAAAEKKIKVNIFGNPDHLFDAGENITIRPRVGLDILQKAENDTDVLVFVCNVRGGQIPGKLYQYSSTCKEILFILDGTDQEIEEIRNYYEQYNRYVFCYNDKEDIKKALDRIINNQAEGLHNRLVEDFLPEHIFNNIVNTII